MLKDLGSLEVCDRFERKMGIGTLIPRIVESWLGNLISKAL